MRKVSFIDLNGTEHCFDVIRNCKTDPNVFLIKLPRIIGIKSVPIPGTPYVETINEFGNAVAYLRLLPDSRTMSHVILDIVDNDDPLLSNFFTQYDQFDIHDL